VDVGYGAPFAAPLPLDLSEDVVVDAGRDQFILRPHDDEGRSAMDHFCDGQRVHGYVVNPHPRTLDHFTDVIRDSYRSEAPFMNAVVLARFYRDRIVRIRNLSIIETTHDREVVTRIESRDELVDSIRRHFGIPGAIVRTAVEGLDRLVEVCDLE
jgi:arylamine N-acetyltransferase